MRPGEKCALEGEHGSKPDHRGVSSTLVRIEEELNIGLQAQPLGQMQQILDFEDAFAPRHVFAGGALRIDEVVREAQVSEANARDVVIAASKGPRQADAGG